ncbi:MAG: RluA family pseudouridine synthase [Paracoccaceae bacterium]|nr:RluA family pseudouridine synthase [Paracoccaceae bacterium]
MNNITSKIVGVDDADQRLDRWLRRKYGHLPQSHIEKMCRRGAVMVNKKKVKPSFRLVPDQIITLPKSIGPITKKAVKSNTLSSYDQSIIHQLNNSIIYEDDYFVALNKPPGLATQGGTKQRGYIDKYLNHLTLANSTDQLRLIHRLDKETSGVLLTGKTLTATREMMELFKTKNVYKYYWAVTLGVPNPKTGEIKSALEKDKTQVNRKMKSVSTKNGHASNTAKLAYTKYSVQLTFGKLLAFVVLSPQTGRTHQLRVHLSSINHPILGDEKYSSDFSETSLPVKFEELNLVSRMFLHASSLRFHHPFLNREITIKAEVPEHFQELASYLEWDLNNISETTFQ